MIEKEAQRSSLNDAALNRQFRRKLESQTVDARNKKPSNNNQSNILDDDISVQQLPNVDLSI